ncbi:hypothetical protein TanjilG_24151 [Lupinus angustifolius]|uniref:Aluminum-activated malate transporter n=2 Tax=Lupinus angustifolius TaxID=3871 RepID=A0A1J7GU00_LUPAN|nr:hypothetical protein TanjilG_24151 [Lupinus angustifolius]
MVIKLEQDDPRRVIHSFKVGLALVLISILQHIRPTFYAFGDNILWAVLTVALVLEFSVGATLGKGLNRILATWLAGALGVGTRSIANLCGQKGEAVLTTIFVFVIAGSVTFMRFSPRLKARYDYGFIIFILTFCMVSLSDDKERAMLKLAQERLLTIIIGSFVAVIVCICICPVWIGQDLHNQIAANMEKIAHFFEGFSDEYLKKSENTEVVHDRSFLHRYKSVLSSKSSEETMAVLARWEPRHGGFRFRHPWKQYLKIGNLIRLCAYNIEVLIACLPHSDQVSLNYEVGNKIKESCTIISSECGKTLKEASLMVKHMTMSSMHNSHVANAKNAIQTIKSILRTNPWEGVDYDEIIQVSTLASLLIDVVNCIQNICEAVDELASLAKFQPSQLLHHRGTVVQPVDDSVHVIAIIETPPILELRNEN